MSGFIVRLLISAVGLWLASAIIPGLVITGLDTLILAAILQGFINAVIRPIAIILTLPFTILTLGMFLLVINAAMLGLVAALLDDFVISGFFAALFGSLVISFFSWWASWAIGPAGKIDLIVINKGR